MSLVITGNPLWLLGLALGAYFQKKFEAFGAMFFALMMIYLLPSPTKVCSAHCSDLSCSIRLYSLQLSGLALSNTPDQFVRSLSGLIQVTPLSSLLPITRQIMTSLTSIDSSEVITPIISFPQSLSLGLKYHRELDRLFLFGGWAHYFCFSGWHAKEIYKHTFKRKRFFAIVAIVISWYLNYSFPFIRSAIELLVTGKSKSLAITLLLLPYSVLTMSFWLTLYYQFILHMCHWGRWSLFLGNMAFCQLFMGKINIIIFLLFQLLAPLAPHVIMFYIFSSMAIFFFPEEVLFFDVFLNSVASILLKACPYYVSIPNSLCWLYIIASALRWRFYPVRAKMLKT